jgi:hypothetical protein
MAKPYSQDLRNRVVAAAASGRTCLVVAVRFGVSVASVVKWSQRPPLRLVGEREGLLARIAALDDADVEECVAGTIGQLDKANALVRVVPLDPGSGGRAGGLSNCGPRGGAYPKLRDGGW